MRWSTKKPPEKETNKNHLEPQNKLWIHKGSFLLCWNLYLKFTTTDYVGSTNLLAIIAFHLQQNRSRWRSDGFFAQPDTGLMLFKQLHPLKAQHSMLVTEWGMVMPSKDLHSAKPGTQCSPLNQGWWCFPKTRTLQRHRFQYFNTRHGIRDGDAFQTTALSKGTVLHSHH